MMCTYMLQMQLIGKFHTPADSVHTYNPVAASHAAKVFSQKKDKQTEIERVRV